RRLARDDGAGHRDHTLESHGLRRRQRGAAGVEHALGQAVVVAQVDEEQPAVVALAMDPARQPHGAADVARAQLAARVRAIRGQGVAHLLGPLWGSPPWGCRGSCGRARAFGVGRRAGSSRVAYPQKPWVTRSSSCFFTFFRLTSKDTRSPSTLKALAARTAPATSPPSSTSSATRRCGASAPAPAGSPPRSARIEIRRSKPIEKPEAGTSRPSSRPIIRSYRPPPAMEEG